MRGRPTHVHGTPIIPPVGSAPRTTLGDQQEDEENEAHTVSDLPGPERKLEVGLRAGPESVPPRSRGSCETREGSLWRAAVSSQHKVAGSWIQNGLCQSPRQFSTH